MQWSRNRCMCIWGKIMERPTRAIPLSRLLVQSFVTCWWPVDLKRNLLHGNCNCTYSKYCWYHCMFYFLAYFRCHSVFTWQITLAYGGVGLWEVVVGGGGWLGVEVFFVWGSCRLGWLVVGGGWCGWVVEIKPLPEPVLTDWMARTMTKTDQVCLRLFYWIWMMITCRHPIK